jgi:hypothetical protein
MCVCVCVCGNCGGLFCCVVVRIRRLLPLSLQVHLVQCCGLAPRAVIDSRDDACAFRCLGSGGASRCRAARKASIASQTQEGRVVAPLKGQFDAMSLIVVVVVQVKRYPKGFDPAKPNAFPKPGILVALFFW